MYVEKLLDVKIYFIGLTNTLLYVWDSNTVYMLLIFGTGDCWLSVCCYRTSFKISLSNTAPFSTDNLKLDRIPSKII